MLSNERSDPRNGFGRRTRGYPGRQSTPLALQIEGEVVITMFFDCDMRVQGLSSQGLLGARRDTSVSCLRLMIHTHTDILTNSFRMSLSIHSTPNPQRISISKLMIDPIFSKRRGDLTHPSKRDAEPHIASLLRDVLPEQEHDPSQVHAHHSSE